MNRYWSTESVPFDVMGARLAEPGPRIRRGKAYYSFGYNIDVSERPWMYADRAPIGNVDLFPRWTAFVDKVCTVRWRISNAWAALHGGELDR